MRVTSIGLYSEENEIANFNFDDPTSDNPYLASSVVGLDADEIIPKFYGFSKMNRDRLYDFSMKPREIVIRVLLRPHREISETYSSLRDNLYRAISPVRGGLIDVRFNDGGVPWFAYIRGFITKLESFLFQKKPEVQITISCEDPVFRGFNALHFEEDSSDTGLDPFIVVDSISTAPHGFQIELEFSAGASELSIIDRLTIGPNPDWEFKLIYPFLTGDVLNVNSQVGARAVTVTRSAVVTAIADKIAPDSVWPLIFPGTNELTFTDPDILSLNYVEFTPEFWGV